MDFTEVAMNAFRYANALFPNDQLYIVHVYSGAVSTREPLYLQPGKTKDMVLREELAKQIQREIQVQKLPPRIHIEMLEGEVIDSVRNYVQDKDIEQMVIGTRDKYDFFDRWIGTVSLGLVKTLDIPVYLIPRYAKFDFFDKVMVASDYHLQSKAFVRQISKWNESYNAFVKFLHIQSTVNESFEKEEDTIVDILFEEENVNFSFEVDSIRSNSIVDSLLANAYNFGADLLAVIPDNQNFLQALLFRSISKELILKSTIPLLFLHPKKKINELAEYIFPAKEAKFPNLMI